MFITQGNYKSNKICFLRFFNCFISGFKVYTFKNPYLGNTCVPFQHYACSFKCAKAIEIPAHAEQRRAAQKMDRQYQEYIKAIQSQQKEMRTKKSSCCIL